MTVKITGKIGNPERNLIFLRLVHHVHPGMCTSPFDNFFPGLCCFLSQVVSIGLGRGMSALVREKGIHVRYIWSRGEDIRHLVREECCRVGKL